jgi:hypothetical protein
MIKFILSRAFGFSWHRSLRRTLVLVNGEWAMVN